MYSEDDRSTRFTPFISFLFLIAGLLLLLFVALNFVFWAVLTVLGFWFVDTGLRMRGFPPLYTVISRWFE
jgi:uncharacterized membrane protein